MSSMQASAFPQRIERIKRIHYGISESMVPHLVLCLAKVAVLKSGSKLGQICWAPEVSITLSFHLPYHSVCWLLCASIRHWKHTPT